MSFRDTDPPSSFDGQRDAAIVSRFAAALRTRLAAQPAAEAIRDVARLLALPVLGDVCIVELLEPGVGRRRLVANVLPASLDARLRAIVDDEGAVLEVDYPVVAALGASSSVAAPLRVGGVVVGTMTFATVSDDGRRLGPADAVLVEALADQAGYALESVRLARGIEQERVEREQAEARLRHHEAALRQSEAELQGFFDAPASLLTIFELDDESRDVVIRRPSAAVAALVGMTVRALTDRSLRALGADEARVASLYTHFRHCRETGAPVAFDLDACVHTGDGRWSVLPLRCVASRIGDDARSARIAAMAFDLTALRQREAELAGFFEAPGILMAIIEADDARQDIVIQAANSTFAEFHGHMLDGVIGRTGRDIGISDSKVAQLYTHFRQCRESGAPLLYEMETDAPSGHWVLASLRRIGSDPKRSPIASVFTDVTALRESQARLAGFFDAPGAPMAIFGMDGATADARVIRANIAFAALWDMSPEELEGRMLRSLADDEALVAEQFAMLDHCRQSGEPVVRETRMPRRGDERTFLITLRLIASDARHATVALTALETTSQNRLQAELLQAQKMEAVGHLAGGVAHDFNNVLTVISGATEALLAGAGSERERRVDLLDIRRAVDRAAELTRQLLAFSRRQSAEPLPVTVNDVVREMHPMLRRLLRSSIIVELSLDDELPPVLADAGQLGQVLLNLVLNARDAMPEGGRITISTCRRAGASLMIETRPGDPRTAPVQDTSPPPTWAAGSALDATTSYVVLTVADTGVGMPEEVRARVFEPFFSTKGPERGTGLGLPTVSTIIRRAGGFVWVESAQCVGTRFSVALPALLAPAEIEAAQAMGGGTDAMRLDGTGSSQERHAYDVPGRDTLSQERSASVDRADVVPVASTVREHDHQATLAAPLTPGGMETVLLVEDDAAVRLFATRALRLKGYHVLQAASREEALAVVATRGDGIDVLAYDLDLPDAVGPAAMAFERLLVASAEAVAVVRISGSMSSRDAGDRTATATVPFVAKPFTAEELAMAIRNALDAGKQRTGDRRPDRAPPLG